MQEGWKCDQSKIWGRNIKSAGGKKKKGTERLMNKWGGMIVGWHASQAGHIYTYNNQHIWPQLTTPRKRKESKRNEQCLYLLLINLVLQIVSTTKLPFQPTKDSPPLLYFQHSWSFFCTFPLLFSSFPCSPTQFLPPPSSLRFSMGDLSGISSSCQSQSQSDLSEADLECI